MTTNAGVPMSGRRSRSKGGTMLAEWRPIPGYPFHAVNEHGVVMRVVDGVTRKAGFVLTPFLRFNSPRGYWCVKLTDGHRKRTVCVHTLVTLAFHGAPPSSEHQVAHYDGDSHNNHASNLRWATVAENNGDDKKRHGTHAGERNPRAKLTWGQVREARAQYSGKYGEQRRLARAYGVSESAMRSALVGEHWRGR